MPNSKMQKCKKCPRQQVEHFSCIWRCNKITKIIHTKVKTLQKICEASSTIIEKCQQCIVDPIPFIINFGTPQHYLGL